MVFPSCNVRPAAISPGQELAAQAIGRNSTGATRTARVFQQLLIVRHYAMIGRRCKRSKGTSSQANVQIGIALVDESTQIKKRRGPIELICGCMFSGKSERLLARLADAKKQSVQAIAFKHAADDRYAQTEIVTHSGWRAEAHPIATASKMLELVGDAQLVCVDEAQFFNNDLVETCQRLAEQGRDVVVAGLDLDSWGQPFGPVPALETVADKVTRTYAVCSMCGGQADHTQRLGAAGNQKMIGGPESYQPRCARCWQPPADEPRQ